MFGGLCTCGSLVPAHTGSAGQSSLHWFQAAPTSSLSLPHTRTHYLARSHTRTWVSHLESVAAAAQAVKKLPMQWNIEIWSNGHDKSRRFFPTHKKSLKSSKNWQKQTFSICSELKEKMCKAGTTREHQQELKFSLEQTISKPLCLALRW